MASSKNYKFYMLLFAFYYGFGAQRLNLVCTAVASHTCTVVTLPDKLEHG
jgi:hypothetical protein